MQSKDLKSYLTGTFGGDGLGAMIATPFSAVFQGTGGDNGVYYTFNALTNAVVDSTNKTATVSGGQYFIDTTDSANPVVAVVTLPKFTLNNNTYIVNLSTTLSDGVTSRYTLVVGGKSYLFDPDNAHVTVDHTVFTFNPLAGGVYTVSYASTDAPAGGQAPSPIALTPFFVAAGGAAATIDVFNNSGGLNGFVLGPSRTHIRLRSGAWHRHGYTGCDCHPGPARDRLDVRLHQRLRRTWSASPTRVTPSTEF